MSEIWAVLEHRDGSLHEHSDELLAELAELVQHQPAQATLSALLLTSPDLPEPDTTPLTNAGIQHLYFLSHPQLADYTTVGYVNALSWLIQQRKPQLVVTSATANGRDWMPR